MKRGTTMDSHQEEPLATYKIYVKMLKTVALDVNWTDTVDQIKSKFCALEGVDKSAQELFFAGVHLKNDNKLADYNIKKNASVDLYVTDGMQITVKIPSVGKTIKLNVRKTNRVADVKAEIEKKEGILMITQILMYAGRQLEDNQTLSQCDLRDDQTLHVLVCPNDKLRVFVNVGDQKVVSLNVKCWYTVADVKLMIENLEGLDAHTQIITRPQSGVDMVLVDSQTLQAQSVKNNLTLMLQQNVHQTENNVNLMLEQNVQIFIKTWEGKTITMHFKMTDTGMDVVKKIEEKLLIKECMFFLCYRGRVLSSGDTLQKHNVESNSTIHMCLRLRGPEIRKKC